MPDILDNYLQIVQTQEGLLLALIIFSSGIGIGAAIIQINSIRSRKGSDAATSVVTWMLLLTFSLTMIYYLWHISANLVLPLLLGALALSSAAGLAISFRARHQLAAIAEARRQPSDTALLQDYNLARAASSLRKRLRSAREQR